MTTHRQQILDTAARLFAEQGYLETGINQLIEESAVARRTFYHHFPSKEELGAAYLEAKSEEWLAVLRRAVESRRSAGGVVRGIFERVEELAKATKFRGCSLLNMAAEFAQANSAMRARVKRAKEAQSALLAQVLGAVGVSNATARQIDVLLEGSIVSAGAHLDVQPIRAAMQAALALVDLDEAARSGSTKGL
jgi:AcrR family transcriptional regulator